MGRPSTSRCGLLAPIYLPATVPIAFRRRWPVRDPGPHRRAVTVTTLLGHSLAPAPLIALPLYSLTLSASSATVDRRLGARGGCPGGGGHDRVGRSDAHTATSPSTSSWPWPPGSSPTRSARAASTSAGLLEQREERQRLEIEEARRAIVEERMAIARELHDVVAHSLSVIAIQSGVGRHVLDTQPDEARKALAAVEATSRAALEELRGVLGVLRRGDDDDPATTSPTPDMGDLDELDRAHPRRRRARAPARHRAGPRPAPRGVELTLYRIIQEALTNVVKHTAERPHDRRGRLLERRGPRRGAQ